MTVMAGVIIRGARTHEGVGDGDGIAQEGGDRSTAVKKVTRRQYLSR